MPEDPIAWLLPDADEHQRTLARRLVSALRLLCDDARSPAARARPSSLSVALAELTALERRQRLRAIEGLAHALLSAALPDDSFLDLGPAPLAFEAACRALLLPRPPESGLVPLPGSEPLCAAERLLARAGELGAPRPWCELWEARRLHLARGPLGAEERWAELARGRLAARPRLQALVLAGRVAARLDRLDPRAALALLAGSEELAAREPVLARLFAWSALFSGRVDVARALLAAAGKHRSRTPPVALEVGEAVEEWRPFFPGPAPRGDAHGAAPGLATREALGALVVAVFLRRRGRLETLHLDASPAHLAGARALAERAPSADGRGELEHALLAGVPSVRRHRRGEDGRELCGALAPRVALAWTAVPLRSREGGLCGWLHVESAHHLLPSSPRLRAIARAWEERSSDRIVVQDVERGAPELRAAHFRDEDPRRLVFRRIAGALGHRGGLRSFLLERAGARLLVRAELGTALDDWHEHPGSAAVLRRVAAGATALAYGCGAGVHRDAGCGACVPIVADGRVEAVLAVEATGRRALLASFLGQLERAVQEAVASWIAASFRAWHASRLGHDVHWDPRSRFLAAVEPALAAAARCSTPLVIAGPDGAGRRTLARCISFRGASASRDALDAHCGARVVDLDTLSRAGQRALARRACDSPDERLVLLTTAPAAAVRGGGALAPELAGLVDPLPLEVPPLADRRDEIPGLVEVIAADVGRTEGSLPARFDEMALADLWRQDWRGNMRELRAIAAQLARLHAGQEVTRRDVRAVLRSRGLEPRERLPSLRPRRLDLVLALSTTRHKNGAFNRARAARYLGWDPDTLEARLRSTDVARSE